MSEASEALKLKDVFATENAALSSTVERLEAQKRDLRAQTSEQRDQVAKERPRAPSLNSIREFSSLIQPRISQPPAPGRRRPAAPGLRPQAVRGALAREA
ncbi:unnamed protein product [Pedinophyceae sp. YPF-701]|nr:unnamed protein product [Pedinophyceae sp. YPF-701]